jgi:hypothetical protein
MAVDAVRAQDDALVDRVLASVEGRVITLSDVRTAMRFGLVQTEDAGDAAAATLDRLIDRAVILTEVNRYAPPEPDASAVREAVARIRSRFDSEERFSEAMRLAGLDEGALAQWARDDLRIHRYLQDRFAGAADPTEEDVESYLRRHEAELRRDGRALDDPEVQRRAREEAVAARRAAVITEWVHGLRDRARVNVAPHR